MNVADVKKMTSRDLFPKVKEADNMILAVRSILRDNGASEWLTDSRIIQALGTMDMAMTSHVLGIKQQDEKKYKTVQAIGHDFLLIAKHLTGAALPLPWESVSEQSAPAAAAASASEPSAGVMLELAEDGSIKEPEKMLASKGFGVGTHTFVARSTR